MSVIAGITLMVLCVAAAVSSASAALRATGPLLLAEAFTGATAVSQFSGYGTACLTGAPPAAVPPGEHPIGGCPAQGAPPAGFESLFPISPPLGADPSGYLRLTDALPDQAGAVLYDTPIRASDGVEITFEMWQYGGYSTIPQFAGQTADGISFFLVDATAALDAPGAFGGSLGYAKKLPDDNPANAMIPGVAGGYLGFGFDVLGNFYGDWEQRGAGCPPDQLSPASDSFLIPAPGANMLTVRGPVGATRALGYCWLAATATGPNQSTLPGTLHGTATGPVSADPATAVAALETSKRTVTMILEPEPVHTVTVLIDFHDGAGAHQVLSLPAPEPIPAAVKFGFAASTGAFTDVHLIRTLRMQSIDPPPSLTLTKTGTPVVEGDTGEGASLRYTFTVTNTGGGSVTNIAVDDPRVDQVDCPSAALAEGESMTCTALYVITAADIAAATITNTATVTAEGRGGPVPPQSASSTMSLGVLAASGFKQSAVLPLITFTAIGLLAMGGATLYLARAQSSKGRAFS